MTLRPLLFAVMLIGGAALAAEPLRYMRIGTGAAGETHFSLGSLIASAISAPPGLPSCARGGACGVPGLIASASATSGAVADSQAVAENRLDAALTEADIPFWATTGTGPFQDHPLPNLRAIANLGKDDLHLVVARDGPIRAMRDLRGRHIAIGEQGSGTEVLARLLLADLGIKEKDLVLEHQRAAVAADSVQAGKLDGFFVMDGAPVPAVAELAKTMPIRLIGITGPAAAKLRHSDPLLIPSSVPGGTYPGIDSDTPTLAVGLTLIVAANLSDDLVMAITRALWQPDTLRLINDARHGGQPILLADALTGLGLPLHPGAQRYYRDHPKIR